MSQVNGVLVNGMTIPSALTELAFLLRAEEKKKGFQNVTIAVTNSQVTISVNLPCSLTKKGNGIVLTVEDYIDAPIRP